MYVRPMAGALWDPWLGLLWLGLLWGLMRSELGRGQRHNPTLPTLTLISTVSLTLTRTLTLTAPEPITNPNPDPDSNPDPKHGPTSDTDLRTGGPRL